MPLPPLPAPPVFRWPPPAMARRYLEHRPVVPAQRLTAYPTIKKAFAEEDQLGNQLQPLEKGFLLPAQRFWPWSKPKGSIVLLHGFSAGPWQYHDFATRFAQRGWNVYVPRLVGHGFRHPNGSDDPSHIPGVGQVRQWIGCADKVMEEARELEGPLFVAGLSGGGTVALDLAKRHAPNVSGVVLYDPFLGPGRAQARGLFRVTRRLPLLGNVIVSLLPVTFSGCAAAVNQWGRPGHSHFNAGQIRTLADYGRRATTERPGQGPPLLMISTDAADVVDRRPLARVVAERPDNRWVRFGPESKVPHAMVCPLENEQTKSLNEIFDETYRFVDTRRRYSSSSESSSSRPSDSSSNRSASDR